MQKFDVLARLRPLEAGSPEDDFNDMGILHHRASSSQRGILLLVFFLVADMPVVDDKAMAFCRGTIV